MARLITGEYRIYFFDAYGERQKNARQVYARCFTEGITKGRRYSKLCGYHSFRIDRSIYNSLDTCRYHNASKTRKEDN